MEKQDDIRVQILHDQPSLLEGSGRYTSSNPHMGGQWGNSMVYLHVPYQNARGYTTDLTPQFQTHPNISVLVGYIPLHPYTMFGFMPL